MGVPSTTKANDLVVVHVTREPLACRACGSQNMLTIHVPVEDTPIWVRVCSDCDERVSSLDR